METWISKEMRNLDLGDTRRNERFSKIAQMLMHRPGAGILQSSKSPYHAKATYNFFSHRSVNTESILSPHIQSTVERSAREKIILAVQDTSNFNFASSPAEDLGRLDRGGRGLMVHPTMLLNKNGIALGIVSLQIWARKKEETGKAKYRASRPVEEKESMKWLRGMKDAEGAVQPEKLIHIGDRESDIYELFVEERKPCSELLIRAHHNRKTSTGEKIRDAVEKSEIAGEEEIETYVTGGQKKRKAAITYQSVTVELRPPDGKSLPPVSIQVILVKEPNPPKGEKGIEWLLLTTLKANTKEEIMNCVKYYCYRWMIERFFYICKSGLSIEKLQLEKAERLKNAIATFSIVAWRLLHIDGLAKRAPETPCTEAFKSEEWQLLYRMHHNTTKLPKTIPTMQEVVKWIAMIGGFMGRKSDGPPGVKNLWRGLTAFTERFETWQFLLKNPL